MNSSSAASSELTQAIASDEFEGLIGPKNLLSLIHNTADFLFHDLPLRAPGEAPVRLHELANSPFGFIDILRHAEHWEPRPEERPANYLDYFALCIAAHHATVATFVPTDVDSKIRGVLWKQVPDNKHRRAMLDCALHWLSWDTNCLSRRCNEHSGVGPVSGHNGEQLGTLSGGLGSLLAQGDLEYAEKAAEAIDAELRREANEFLYVSKQRGMEIELLQLSASLTHNTGDLNQGISYWENLASEAPYRERFEKLSQRNTGAYQRAYEIALALYKPIVSPEGHRHYPLRGVPALRRSKELLLPLAPFLDDWGSKVAASRLLNDQEKAEVLSALLQGCRKIPGQVGYFRAIAGMLEALGWRIEQIAKLMPASSRSLFKDSEFRRQFSIRRVSFESTMRKRAQEILKRAS